MIAGVTLRAVPYDDPDAARLVTAMAHDIAERYGGNPVSPADSAEFAPPTGTFLLAVSGGEAVGCAGLRPLGDGVGEVKRMYVVPAARGHGVARALLRALVAHARAAGLSRLQLETGTQQPEAMALYANESWQPITPYGHYRDSPLSRCFALQL